MASLLSLLEPGFQVGELLADLVKHLVEGAVLGIVLVKLGLVSDTLLHRQYGGISTAIKINYDLKTNVIIIVRLTVSSEFTEFI